MPNDVLWVYGDNSDLVYIASANEVLVLKLTVKNKEITEIKPVWNKKFNGVKNIAVMTSNVKKSLIVLTK